MKILVTLLFVIGGCASMMADERREELREKVAVIIRNHTSDEDLARAWGPPTKRDVIGSSEFWTYLWVFDSKTTGFVSGNVVIAKNRARFDEIVLEFRNGVVVHGSVTVRR